MIHISHSCIQSKYFFCLSFLGFGQASPGVAQRITFLDSKLKYVFTSFACFTGLLDVPMDNRGQRLATATLKNRFLNEMSS